MAERLVTENARQDRVQYYRVRPRPPVRRREQLERSRPKLVGVVARGFSQHARLPPDMVRRAYRLLTPLAKLGRLVEADKPPAASHQRAHVTAKASYPPYLLQLPPAIDDPIRRRIVQAYFQIVSFVPPKRPLDFIAVQCVFHFMSPSVVPLAASPLRSLRSSAQSPGPGALCSVCA